MIKLSDKESAEIKGGNLTLLLEKLQELDTFLIKQLKNNTTDGRFYQGTSRLNDVLIKTLS